MAVSKRVSPGGRCRQRRARRPRGGRAVRRRCCGAELGIGLHLFRRDRCAFADAQVANAQRNRVSRVSDVDGDGGGGLVAGAGFEFNQARFAYVNGGAGELLYTRISPNERSFGLFGLAVSEPRLHRTFACPFFARLVSLSSISSLSEKPDPQTSQNA